MLFFLNDWFRYDLKVNTMKLQSTFRYLELQGTVWNTSSYPYFDISDFQNWRKQLIEQPT